MPVLLGNRVLCIGDSIIYGTGDATTLAEGAFRFHIAKTLPATIKSQIRWCGDNVASGYESSGNKMCGATGQRIDEINASYDVGGQCLRWQPSLVPIHLGTNDMTQLNSGTWVGGSVSLSVTNMGVLLDSIRNNAVNAVVILCKLMPNQTAGANTNIVSWNTSIATAVAGRSDSGSIVLADIYTAFTNNASWATDYMADNTHPNSAGNSVMASQIITSITGGVTIPIRPIAEARA